MFMRFVCATLTRRKIFNVFYYVYTSLGMYPMWTCCETHENQNEWIRCVYGVRSPTQQHA